MSQEIETRIERSTPAFFEFNPFHIKYQAQVIHDIDMAFDYKLGTHEILLSGSVGSAKSILAAHCGIKHCLRYSGARLVIARRALPDIKKTIFQTILEHLQCDELKEGKDYRVRETNAEIIFRNGSMIQPLYWSDKKFKRARSLQLSAAIIEELTENEESDRQAFFELKARIGRLPHIPEQFLIACTNPDSPRHWAYKYFIEPEKQGRQFPTRHVYYSRTEDNPFLASSYIEQLKTDYDPKEARRMLYGEWVEVDEERIYSAYQSENNFRPTEYKIIKGHPITICFDFNIGEGKPMSSVAYQYDINGDQSFHLFDECIVHGARTADIMDEWNAKGIFSQGCKIIVHGDATGAARTTKSIHSDYDIIKKFLENSPGVIFEMQVPRENPPVRLRHNKVNGYCLNELGKHRLFVYEKCKVTDEGMRLTALKKGGSYIEDDSKAYQHVTTALGYGVVYDTNKVKTRATAQRVR
jgi:PBSX family phage terminase large subunit